MIAVIKNIMKFRFLLFLLFTILNTKAQTHRLFYTDVDFRENHADTLDIKLETILIVGVGKSLERIFLDDLSDKLIKDFALKKIKASYIYLGNTTEEVTKNYKEINKSKYNAILLFFPTGESVFEVRHISTGAILPNPMTGSLVIFNRTRTSYEQSFDIVFVKTDTGVTKIWGASVDIDCEPGKKIGAKRLCNKILTRFKFNRYID